MVRRRDIKKSQFTAVTESETNDYFDFVRNGQNLKISQENLAAFMGVSGTIESLGEPAAVPVLQVMASVNYIRNILGGSGIRVQVSPQNGIILDHNFTVDSTGAPIMINATAESPTLRSIQAGTGIDVTEVNGSIEISTKSTPASNKTVFVYELADFPTPVAGVITLLANTEYRLQNDVSSVNRFQFSNNTVLSGSDEMIVTLGYTGVGTMLTASDVNFTTKNVNLSCSSGTLFNVTSSTGFHLMRSANCTFTCNNAGNLDNLALVYMFNCSFQNIFTQGLTFTGVFGVAFFNTLGATMLAGSGNLFTLGTATFQYFIIDKGLFQLNTTGYLMSGLPNSGNILPGGLGMMISSRNFGTGANPPSDNITPFEDRWESNHNSSLPDSYDVVLATHGTSTIVISAPATPVIIGATWATERAYRFTGTAGGRWTHTGKGTNVEITASITATLSTGTDNVSFFMYKNGVQITESRVVRQFVGGDPGNLSLLWETDLETGDYLELWGQNDDATVNFDINTATIRIRS